MESTNFSNEHIIVTTPARTISIASDFSRFPAGRYLTDGPFSGEAFRGQWLIPALRQGLKIEVNLDGTAGFGSSFLEEAFGGLLRNGFDRKTVLENVILTASDQSLIEEIKDYIRSATPTQ